MFTINFEFFTLCNENGEQFGVLLSGDTIAGNQFCPFPTEADAKTAAAMLAKVKPDNFTYNEKSVIVDGEAFYFSNLPATARAVSLISAYQDYQSGRGRRVGEEKNSFYNKLKRRAKKHGLLIRKYKRGEDSFMLVDAGTNAVVSYPVPLPLDGISNWLDDLDEQTDDTEQPF